MIGDLMGRINEAQAKMDEIKRSLENKTVEAESGDGAIKVVATASKKIKSIAIDKSRLSDDVEELEDLLTVAVNRALDKAEVVSDEEMKKGASNILPDFPGMF